MEYHRLLFISITLVVTVAPLFTDAQSCHACNCQFNNVEVLSRLIDAKINNILADQPIVKFLLVNAGSGRDIELYNVNSSTLLASEIANFSLTNPSQPATSSNNLFAYRPRYHSGLAGLFINLEGIYPCLAPLAHYNPICRVFTNDEDGFRSGKSFIEAGDHGNSIQIFSTTQNILTFGVAIQDCPEITTSCLPNYHSFTVVCYLPRAACS